MNSKFKNKTIFDFTDDSSLITEIIGEMPRDYYVENVHPVNAIADIATFAKLTNNAELEDEATQELRQVEEGWTIHLDEGMSDGVLID